jgi:hypothetical protein
MYLIYLMQYVLVWATKHNLDLAILAKCKQPNMAVLHVLRLFFGLIRITNHASRVKYFLSVNWNMLGWAGDWPNEGSC